MKSMNAFMQTYGPRTGMFAATQFIVLTLLAMLFYPGGTFIDPDASRYQFFGNFFSELGLTQVYDGTTNSISLILWMTALALAGLGLIIFFLALPHYFSGRIQKTLCYVGTFFGILSGVCYIGVAFTPANLAGEAHRQFVFGAFIFFFVAVLLYFVAVLFNASYPNRYAVVYIVFAVLLGLYIYLLFAGPSSATENGRLVQVTGQKIIGYSALIVTFIQGYGLEKMREPNQNLVTAQE